MTASEKTFNFAMDTVLKDDTEEKAPLIQEHHAAHLLRSACLGRSKPPSPQIKDLPMMKWVYKEYDTGINACGNRRLPDVRSR